MSALLSALGAYVQAAEPAVTPDRWDFAVSLSVEGDADLTTFKHAMSGSLDVQLARHWSDGTAGRVVRFDAPQSPLHGAAVLLRGFPGRAPVSVGPLAPWAGLAGGVESLDLLWIALTPLDAVEGAAVDATYPLWVAGAPHVTGRVTGTVLSPKDGHRVLSGTTSWSGRDVRADGDLAVTWSIAGGRLVAASVDAARTVTTRWPAGPLVQRQTWSLLVSRTDETVAPFLAPPPTGQGTRPADGEPVRLADGSALRAATVDVTETLPFVSVHPDLDPSARARLRARLGAPATIAPTSEPR